MSRDKQIEEMAKISCIDDLRRYIILNENIAMKCKSNCTGHEEEYWRGKLSAFLQIRGYLDTELKKKYTEGAE